MMNRTASWAWTLGCVGLAVVEVLGRSALASPGGGPLGIHAGLRTLVISEGPRVVFRDRGHGPYRRVRAQVFALSGAKALLVGWRSRSEQFALVRLAGGGPTILARSGAGLSSQEVTIGTVSLWVVKSGKFGIVARPEGRRSYKILWAGRLGPVAPNFDRVLDVSPGRLVVFLRPRGLHRCDGRPLRLEPRAYDPKSDRFRPVAFRPGVSGLPEIHATVVRPRGLARAVGLSSLTFRFASSAPGRHGLAGPEDLEILQDGRMETSWRFRGTGLGAVLQAEGPKWPYPLVGLRLVLGPGAPGKAGAVTRLLLALGPKEQYVVQLVPSAGKREYFAMLPKPVHSRCALLVVLDRTGAGSPAISEVSFVTEADRRGGLVHLAGAVAKGNVALSLALRAVSRLGREGTRRILTALSKVSGRAGDFLAEAFLGLGGRPAALVPLLGRLGHRLQVQVASRLGAQVGPGQVGSILEGRFGTDVASAFLRSLQGSDLPAPLVRVLLAHLDSTPMPDQVRLVGVLAHAEPGSVTCGQVLSEGRVTAPRLWLLGLLAREGRLDCRRVLSSLQGVSFRKLGFAAQFRYLQALGWSLRRLPGDQGPRWARTFLEETARHGRDEVLRWAATRLLARLSGTEAILTKLLSDKAPRVRWAALDGLRIRGWKGWVSSALKCLLEDSWPWVRRRCSRLVEAACPKGAGPELVARVQRIGWDEAPEVVSVLANCRYREAGPLFSRVAADWRTHPGRAASAVSVLGELGRNGKLVASVLLGAAKMARGPVDRFSTLAVEAARTLGHWPAGLPREAVAALVQVARHGRFSVLRVAAVEALGAACPQGAPKVLKQLAGSAVGTLDLDRAVREALDRCPRR